MYSSKEFRMISLLSAYNTELFAVGTEELEDGKSEDVEIEKDLKLIDKNQEMVHPLDAYCRSLKNLDISRNNFQQLIGVPVGVMELSVMVNCLSDATMLSHLVHLEFAEVSGNQLTSLAGLRGGRHLSD